MAGLAKYGGCPLPDTAGVRRLPAPERGTATPAPGPGRGDSLADDLQAAARRIFFATGKYELLPASFPALDGVSLLLTRHPLLKIEIEGHTDSIGAEKDNLLLSQRRAQAVLEYLQHRGIPSGVRLTARGYGLFRPLGPNNTPAGRALNRRVEFRILERR